MQKRLSRHWYCSWQLYMGTTAIPVGWQTDVSDPFQVFLFILLSEMNHSDWQLRVVYKSAHNYETVTIHLIIFPNISSALYQIEINNLSWSRDLCYTVLVWCRLSSTIEICCLFPQTRVYKQVCHFKGPTYLLELLLWCWASMFSVFPWSLARPYMTYLLLCSTK